MAASQPAAHSTRSRLGRAARPLHVVALALAAWAVTGVAQSPTPFGIPAAGAPAPAAGIAAVPGSRAQGWLA